MSELPVAASGIIWEPERLDQDEREVEFVIRNIDGQKTDANRQLVEKWLREERGVEARPTKMHSLLTTPDEEIDTCRKKIRDLKNDISQTAQEPDPDKLSTLGLRAYHICTRLGRLVINYPSHKAESDTAMIHCQELIGRLVKLRMQFFSSDCDAGVSLNTPITQTDKTDTRGAYPKSYQPKKVHERRRHVETPSDTNIFNNIRNPVYETPTRTYNHGRNLAATGRRVERDTPQVRTGNGMQFPRRLHQQQAWERVENEREIAAPANYQDRQQDYRFSKAMDTWKIRFDGVSNEISVDEFVFRVETLARSANINLANLVSGIHLLLNGKAASWYWIHVRSFPHQNWNNFKIALIDRFAIEETDAEIRMMVEARKQAQRESFGDFALAVQQLLVRLRRPIGEAETIEILRRNMSQRLQEALLLHHTNTIPELHSVCRRFEKVWYKHTTYRNEPRRVQELEVPEAQVQDIVQHGLPNLNIEECGALAEDYRICWNCKDIGHSFQDCTSEVRNIFCYGCGEPNIYKPNCRKCTAGNGQGKPRAVGLRQPYAPANHVQHQDRVNPFRK